MAASPNRAPTPTPTSRKGVVGVAAALVFASAGAMGLISRWETPAGQTDHFRVYADKLAGGRLTSECNGITPKVTDTPMKVGDVWSAAQCRDETRRALALVQTPLARCFARTPPQHVFDAATSWAWNVGTPSVCGSGAMRAWNAGDWATGCRRMMVSDSGKLQWVYAAGKFYPGLANRRASEMALCAGPPTPSP